MPKQIKQKQKQRQKQSVVVNVNLAKSSRKSSNKQINKSNKQNLPPPVHKVYTTPIHDLSPQMFSGGKQITQPSLAEQINSYLLTIGQGRPTNVQNVLGALPSQNVLGAIPSQNVDLLQLTTPKKTPRMPLRQNINLDAETDTDVDPPLIVKKKLGRKKGSKNKPKIQATEVFNSAEVLGVAETIAEPEYDETKQIPDEFMREQFLLRQPQSNPNENISEPEYSEKSQIPDEFIRKQFLLRQPQHNPVFTSPRPVDQLVDQPLYKPPITKKKISNIKMRLLSDEDNI